MTENNPESFPFASVEEFNNRIYTDYNEAVKILKERQETNLNEEAKSFFKNNIPEVFNDTNSAVLFRQVATPSYEIRRFIQIVKELKLNPILWEYKEDKFVSVNDYKRSLGKMMFFLGKGKKGGSKIESETIIDFNKFNGKTLSEVETLWGQNLLDFHHELLESFRDGTVKNNIFDASLWFSSVGGEAKYYYTYFLALFVSQGILFENFMLNEEEEWFTKNVFWPAFIEVEKHFGIKPIIVALEPTSIEGDKFWNCHPPETWEIIKNKLNS